MWNGSSGSRGGGIRAVFTAQKRQARVQVSLPSMKVAVPLDQHSATLGQRASSHTVFSLRSRSIPLIWVYFSPPGGRIFNHSGLRLAMTCAALDGESGRA